MFPRVERNLSVFGENLKAARLRRKLSMEQVAELLKRPASTEKEEMSRAFKTL